MFKTRKGLLVVIAFLFFSGWINVDAIQSYFSPSKPSQTHEINISKQRQTHILYGDKRGGGHLYGVGKPCKSEFPKDWDAQEIITHVKTLAANDNVSWKKQGNGYYTSEQMVNGVKVRVVLDGQKDDVITAYPVNVARNPCPMRKHANDNFKE